MLIKWKIDCNSLSSANVSSLLHSDFSFCFIMGIFILWLDDH